jgi:hypothetical protein
VEAEAEDSELGGWRPPVPTALHTTLGADRCERNDHNAHSKARK